MMVTSNAVMNCVRHSEAIVVLLFQTDMAISPTGWASASSLLLVSLLATIVSPCFSLCEVGLDGLLFLCLFRHSERVGVSTRVFARVKERTRERLGPQITRVISSPIDRPCVASLCPHGPDRVLSCMRATRVRWRPSVGGSDHVGGLIKVPTVVYDQHISSIIFRNFTCMPLCSAMLLWLL
jgi:hypothetical protein